MTLHEKLLEMQKRVDGVIKDGKNSSDKYDFASDENVLGIFRLPRLTCQMLLGKRGPERSVHGFQRIVLLFFHSSPVD